MLIKMDTAHGWIHAPWWVVLTLIGVYWDTEVVRAQEYLKAPLECKKTRAGAEYRGTLSVTEQGLSCQHWLHHAPHVHSYLEDYLFPDQNTSLAGNRCRNPAGVKARPWCFTNSPDVRWQFCGVPDCGCRKSKAGWDYTGRISVTSSGRRCQRWTSQTPHAQSYSEMSAFPDPSIEDAGNYCRNPDRWETKGPWCYTEDPNMRWEYCHVPYCECKVSRGGHQYGGRISRTRSGRTCQRWDTQTPHAHRYAEKACGFPEESVSEAANYCRNPEPNELEGPWCFTTDAAVRWEYCDVSTCGPDDDVYLILKKANTSRALKADDPSAAGLSRIELVFLGLFTTSLVLTIITITAAIAVVHVYRKRNLNYSHACVQCPSEVRIGLEDNAENVRTLKRQELTLAAENDDYERGKFGDTVKVRSSRSAEPLSFSLFDQYDKHLRPDMIESMAAHTYDSIASTGKVYDTGQNTGQDSPRKLVQNTDLVTTDTGQRGHHSNMYENVHTASYHAVISPKTGKKVLRFDRRSSIS